MNDRVAGQPEGRLGTHDVADAGLLIVAAALAATIAAHGPSILRLALIGPFVLFAPGWALVTNSATLRSRAALPVAVLLSLSLVTLVSTVLLWAHEWRPLGVCEIEALASIVLIVVGFVRRNNAERRLVLRPPRIDRYPDGALLVGIGLAVFGITRSHVTSLGQFGLLPNLSPIYYAGLLLVLLSACVAIARSATPSKGRMTLHVTALVVLLFGLPSVLYNAPRYAWLYKLIGVTKYIQVHGGINQHVDIYQNWPGLFATIAWIDRIGAIQPIELARWAQPGFELLSCFVLYFALRALRLTERERWLSLLFYVTGAWIAQDYLSPQAYGMVLSLGVLGIALHWLEPKGSERKPESRRFVRVTSYLDNLRRSPSPETPLGAADHDMSRRDSWSQFAIFATLGVVFFALVVVHELTPYVVLLQLGVLTLFGRFRPICIFAGLVAIAVAYLAPRFGYINTHYGLLASIGNFFGNARPPSASLGSPTLGIAIAEYAARGLSVGVWVLGLIGAIRRWRSREPILVQLVLAGAPILVLFAESYGGEAILRVFLYSLPWTAALAAASLRPLRVRVGVWTIALQTAALTLTTCLFLVAFYGEDEINQMPAAQVAAIADFYQQSRPGTVFVADSNYPADSTAAYPGFEQKSLFGAYSVLGTGSLGVHARHRITTAIEHANPGRTSYVVITGSMLSYGRAYGYPKSEDVAVLKATLASAPGWIRLHQSGGVWIYELPA